ncbi:RDD family protein [Streptomyces sp. cmx-10-25]|uniref:RDD family protein n=1 Tax=Streptomyces sp. cmx-10-25 TaxID=2790919 RepID=UPI00397FBA2E
MATPPGGGGEVPQAGYYPDPSIPGYIRYWNGGAWVPGTSRPAPSDGGAPSRPPAAAAPAGPILAPGPATTPQAAPERPAASVPAQAQAPEQNPAQARTQDRSQAPAHVPAQAPAPAPAPAPVAAQARPETPAPVRASAPAPVPTVEETGPVFLDEDPAPAESAPAWRADGSRQAGSGGDRDREVSWGAPRTPDPRTPVEWPVAGANDQAEAQPRAQAQAPAPVRAPAPARPADPRPTGKAARLGGMPVTPIPTPAPAPAPQPAPDPAPAPAPAPAPSWVQPQSPPQPQAHPQSQPQEQSQQPVVPWKPPVEDPFLQAARAQASARPAGLGRRLVARLIDSVVAGALVGAAALPFVTAALDHIEGKIEAARRSGTTVQVWLVDSTTSVQFGIALAALIVVGILYEVLPTAKWGRTLGKKLCGIQVRDIEAHEPPTFGGALKRWLVHGVLWLLAVGVLNVLWCLFDRPWRQCWHDKAARTFVAR